MEILKEEIKTLLDKFSRGETSPDEEKAIRIYLRLNSSDPENAQLCQEFERTKEKKNLKTSAYLYIKNFFQTIKPQKIALFLFFFVLLLYALFALRSNNELGNDTDESFALIKGVKIEEKEFIENYGKKKIRKIQLSISDCLSPLENIKKIQIGFDKEFDTFRLIKNSFNPTDKNSSTKQEENEKNDSTTASDTIKQQPAQPDTKIAIQ